MEDHLKYPFGFLITRENFVNKYRWKETELNKGWRLFYSDKNDFATAGYDNTLIKSLGYFFDIRNGHLDQKSILNNLIYARKQSFSKFIDELGYISGRYVFILTHNDETRIFNDVSGMKTVCFHENKDIIGSHDTLINEVTENKIRQVFFSPSEISFSYHTRFESVQKLIPNMSLEINTKRLERFYPLKDYPLKTSKEIVLELTSYLNETIRWLDKSNYRLLLSLTGGGDSRTSLALLKNIIHKVETFTYLKDTTNFNSFVQTTFKNDKEIVDSIVKNLNLKHNFFTISTRDEVQQSIIETIKHNVMSDHGLNLAHDYYNLYGNQNYLHIRSTGLFNIAKYIFPSDSMRIEKWDTATIAKYTRKWSNISGDKEIIDHLNHLLDYAQLQDFYNYNPLDLLYVSYRMIQRHSGLVNESDIAFETMVLLNSRHILDLLLSYPIEDRKKNKLSLMLITELWPLLHYWDINQPIDLKTKYEKTVEELNTQKKLNEQLFLGLVDTSTSQETALSCVNLDNGLMIKFSDIEIKEKECYEIRINPAKFNGLNSIKFKVKFFYKNPKGRDRITVTSNFLQDQFDILDLYGENEFKIDKSEFKEFYLRVEHHNQTESPSWVEASRIWIGCFENII